MQKSLIELVNTASEIEKALIESGGALSPELEEKLQVSTEALPVKVDSYIHIMQRLEQKAEFYKMQADFFLRLMRGADNSREKLKENIKSAMEILATAEINGNQYRFQMSKTTPVVIIEDESKIPGEYLITETVQKIDKKKIAQDIESGRIVTGARLEGRAALRMYATKKE